MIKVDMNYKFESFEPGGIREMEMAKDEKGNAIMEENGRPVLVQGPALTMRMVCRGVLANPPRDNDPRTGQPLQIDEMDKLIWADLAMRIHKTTEPINLEPEEVVTLKDFLNRRYNNTLLIQQAFECLDPGCMENARKKRSKKKK